MLDFHLFGRRIIIGYNTEPMLRFGRHKEWNFTAYGCWPILVGIGSKRYHALQRRA